PRRLLSRHRCADPPGRRMGSVVLLFVLPPGTGMGPRPVAALPVVAMGYRRSRTGGGGGRRATLARCRHALRGRGDRLADPNGPPPAGIVPPHLRRVRSAGRLSTTPGVGSVFGGR